MYKITRREITIQDFLKLKKTKPFSEMRQNGKTLGLATIFASQGPTIGRQLKAAGFTEENCDEAIDSFNLTNVWNTAKQNNTKLKEVDLKYVIIGNKLRELFFQTYPSLLERVEREQRFALKQGYVRSYVGPVRHLHELRYLSRNSHGNLIGVDKKLYSKMYANLKNIASNTSIQTAEITHAMPDVTCINTNLKNWKFKSRIFNYVHDSIDLYIYKPEKDVVYALINETAKLNREPYFGIPMEIDITECDLSAGQYYKKGKELNITKFNLNKELVEWNNLHGTNLEFENNIPESFYG